MTNRTETDGISNSSEQTTADPIGQKTDDRHNLIIGLKTDVRHSRATGQHNPIPTLRTRSTKSLWSKTKDRDAICLKSNAGTVMSLVTMLIDVPRSKLQLRIQKTREDKTRTRGQFCLRKHLVV